MKRELIGIKIDSGEKFTRQVKVSMPKNYIKKIDELALSTNVPKRIIVWEALGAYFLACRPSCASASRGGCQ